MSVQDLGVEAKSDRLKKKRIALAICGGIGAVESVRIARELRRHGSEVTAFFTPSVENFITALSVEWACNRPVVRSWGADVSHLDTFDLVVVAPATLNSISKAALGIADNPVTLLIAGQLGRKAPLLFVPAMNAALLAHPLYAEYRKRLEGWSAKFLETLKEENRVKMPEPEVLANSVLSILDAR